MIMRTYTFNECYQMLRVDPKTFRLKEAGIESDHQVSRADRRIRFLTQEQVDRLAQDHGRLLHTPLPDENEGVSSGAFKLLLDRMQRAEAEIACQPYRLEEAQRYGEDLVRRQQEEFSEYHVTLNGRITDLAEAVTNQFNELQEQLQVIEQKVDQTAETFAKRLKAVSQADRDAVKLLRELLEAHSTDQARTLDTLEASLTDIQTRQDDIQVQIEALEKDRAQDLADLHDQLAKAREGITEKITTLVAEVSSEKAVIVEIQQQADTQEHCLTSLLHLIQEEISARQVRTSEVAQKKSPTKSKKTQSIPESK